MRDRFRTHVRSRRFVALTSLVVAGACAAARGAFFVSGDSTNAALVARLERDGLHVAPDAIEWIDPPSVGLRDVVFLAANGDEPTDFHAARVRTAGHDVLDVVLESNVSRTPGAAETSLVRNGDFAAYLSVTRGRVDALTVVDLNGEPLSLTADWPARARAQNAVTNLLETTRGVGFGRRRYAIEPSVETATLTEHEGQFRLELPDAVVTLNPETDEPLTNASRLALAPQDKGMPGGVTWLVDTVRGLSFVGPEPIAWLENRVYGIRDRVQRLRYRIFGSDEEAEPVVDAAVRRRRQAALAELGAIGFPPPALAPILSPATPGEGEWLAVIDDSFVGSYPNAAPAFAETSVRADPERPYARIHLIAWDPRQVQLRAVSGTREPESASGAFGTGTIPRVPSTLPRVVGAFNGGFQAMHGEFGMMADSVVYLPPKPFAATVGVMDDGQIVMGSWLGLPEGARTYSESAGMAQIPAGMLDFRQNLTSVLEGDRVNPWERWYWGAANINATEQTFVDRSALCVTREGFVIYFWGQAMGIEALGEAMKRAHCDRGMHLDMNSKYTAFEYYDVLPTSRAFPPLGRALHEKEFEIEYPGVPDFHVRGRIGVAQMEPIRVPRYLETDRRDFFYLELVPTLPGPNLPDGTRFDVRNVPQSTYPWAFARAEQAGATLLRIDPARAVPAPVDATMRVHGQRALATIGASSSGDHMLVATHEGTAFRYSVVRDAGTGVVVLRGAGLADAQAAEAAIGVDGEGFLVYAEAENVTALRAALAVAGVVEAIVVPARFAFDHEGSPVNVRGEVSESVTGVALLERAAPYTGVLNPGVVPVGYSSWGRIQDTRVRYHPEPGPRRFNQH